MSRRLRRSYSEEEMRFSECRDCRFFKIFNPLPACKGCTAGENFEEYVRELNPDKDRLLKPSKDFHD